LIFNFSGGNPQSRLAILYLRSAKQHNAPSRNSDRNPGIFTVSAVFFAQLHTPDFAQRGAATIAAAARDNLPGFGFLNGPTH